MKNYNFEYGVTELPLVKHYGANNIKIYNKFTGKYASVDYPIQKILSNPDYIHKIFFSTFNSWSRFKCDYCSIEKVLHKYDIIESTTLTNGVECSQKLSILEIGYDDYYYIIASRKGAEVSNGY